MGLWTRAETELLINVASATPQQVEVTTNWGFYVNRIKSSEGFQQTAEFAPEEGGREIRGFFDQSEFSWVRFRNSMSPQQQAEWEQQRALLEPRKSMSVPFRAGSYERETLIHAEPLLAYWLRVDTDMAHWVRRMDAHPFAVCIAEQFYRGGDPESIEPLNAPDASAASSATQLSEEEAAAQREAEQQGESTNVHRLYLVPRQLLQIRQRRVQLSEEQKQVLRDRLGIAASE